MRCHEDSLFRNELEMRGKTHPEQGWEQDSELGQGKVWGLQIIFPEETLFYTLVSNKVAEWVPKANSNCSGQGPGLPALVRRVLPGWEGPAGSGEGLSAARGGAAGSKPRSGG